jgi:hypothetical protein
MMCDKKLYVVSTVWTQRVVQENGPVYEQLSHATGQFLAVNEFEAMGLALAEQEPKGDGEGWTMYSLLWEDVTSSPTTKPRIEVR